MKIFIVEDSSALRERLSRTISSIPDVEVIGFADNAPEAVDRIAETKPNLVILDCRLHDSTGVEVLRQIKAHGQGPTAIVLTNYPYPQYRTRYLQAGADYFFDKSTELDQAVRVIQSLAHQIVPPPLAYH